MPYCRQVGRKMDVIESEWAAFEAKQPRQAEIAMTDPGAR